jgi:hypothetical protein
LLELVLLKIFDVIIEKSFIANARYTLIFRGEKNLGNIDILALLNLTFSMLYHTVSEAEAHDLFSLTHLTYVKVLQVVDVVQHMYLLP